ncbi:hypothetical protein [Staphylococcus aureus]
MGFGASVAGGCSNR